MRSLWFQKAQAVRCAPSLSSRLAAAIAAPEPTDATAHSRSLTGQEGKEAPSPSDPDPVPVVTYLLLASIVVLFILMWRAGDGEPSRVAREFGGKDNDLIRAGQYWRLITPMFLHGSDLHLLTNALSLYWFGTQLERFYGWRKYLVLYLIAGIVGNFVSFLRTDAPSLGASGALFGLVGAGLVFPIRFRALIPEKARNYILSQLLLIAAINLGLGFTIPHVDNWNHMGGLAGGAFVALFLIPEGLEDRDPGRLRNTLITLFAVVALAAIGWAAWAQWQWAGTLAPPPVATYGSGRTDPWWTVQVPKRWRYDAIRGQWRSPESVILQIIDSERNPALVSQTLTLMTEVARTNRQMTEKLLIDGKDASHISIKQPSGNQDIYLISADGGQVVILMLQYPRPSETMSRDISMILKSARIIRTPLSRERSPRNPWPVALP